MVDPRRSSRKGKGQHSSVDVPVNLTGTPLAGSTAQNKATTSSKTVKKRSIKQITKDQEAATNKKRSKVLSKAKQTGEKEGTKKARVTKKDKDIDVSQIGLAEIEKIQAKAAAAEATLKVADQAIKDLNKQLLIMKNQLLK